MEKFYPMYMPAIMSGAQPSAFVMKGEIAETNEKYLLQVLEVNELKTIPDIFDKLSDEKIKGHYAGYLNKAICYDCGIGTTPSIEKAKDFYQLADLQGRIDNGTFECQQNTMTVTNLLNAPCVYEKTALKGCSIAAYLLGLCYYNGTGVVEDDAYANKLFLIAVEGGCSKAAGCLANSFYFGHGVSKNIAMAKKYFKIAFDGGDLDSGVNYVFINIQEGNKTESLSALAILAKNNHPKANDLTTMWLNRFQ